MNTVSLASLEKQLLGNLFSNSAPGASVDEAGNRASALIGLQQTQTTMVTYAFRDFVDYFLKLDAMAKEAAKKYAQTLPPDSGPLYSANLHLDLRIERYKDVDAAEVESNQPVSVQKQINDSSVASRIEVYTPEISADGTVSYSITVIKLAISTGDMQLGAGAAAHSVTVGNAPIAQAGATVGGNLMSFLDQGDYNKAAEQVWDYSSDDAMSLVHEQKRLDAAAADLSFRHLVAAAIRLMSYLLTQERNAAFDLTPEEQALVDAAINGDASDVTRKALIKFLQKKRIELEMARKEALERWQSNQDAHKTGPTPEQINRLLNAFEHLQQTLEKEQTVNSKAFQELQLEVDKANLEGLRSLTLSLPGDAGGGVGSAA